MHSAYIHIPFCRTICTYCDFCKVFYNEKQVDQYLLALEDEIKQKYKGEVLQTLYIGGGTPSCLNASQLESLFQILEKFKMCSNIEYTFECNIENITEEKMRILHKYGVNRISIGVQTFDAALLKFLGRNHSVEEVKQKIDLAKKVGFTNINVDLIYAMPKQTIHDVKKDISLFLELDIPHISTYSLLLEPHTILASRGITEIEEELDAEMYECICNTLKEKGYVHYEVSNFSKEGYASLHNLTYWNNDFYYGFGAGASGYVNGERYDNTRSTLSYIQGKRSIDKQRLNIETQIENELILGFRKMRGISKKTFHQKYGIYLEKISIIRELIEKEILIENDLHIFVNEKYIYVMSEILVQFLDRKEGYIYEQCGCNR